MIATRGLPEDFLTLLDAACDGELASEERATLETFLSEDPQAHRLFVEHVRLRSNVRLWWKGERSRAAGLDRVAKRNDECRMMNDESSERAMPRPPALPIHHSSFIIHHSLFGGVLVSYAIAAVILGAAAVNAWIWQSSSGHGRPQVAKVELPGTSRATVVGRVTAMSGCRLATTIGLAERFARSATVSQGQAFLLERGLVEIVYNSGAQVILQGPAVFEVDSDSGGLLSAGRVTLSVARRDSASLADTAGFEARAATSPRGPATARATAFVLRTPVGRLTSAQGEIGVEVDPRQGCRVCMFDGQAELRGGDGQSRVTRLAGRQSVRIDLGGGGPNAVPIAGRELAASFARRIFRPVFAMMSPSDRMLAGIWLKSIGPEILEGRLIAIGSGKDVELTPARAKKAAETGGSASSAGAQGVSPAPDQPPTSTWRRREGPSGTMLTVSYTFEVADVALDTAIVRGWFLADGNVTTVRFNGKSLAGFVTGNGKPRSGGGDGGFVIANGLVRRINTLEMDLASAPSAIGGGNLVWLRLRLTGIRLPGQKTPLMPAPGKRGAASRPGT